ncbi:M20/M25/M40 family metallo-hydrolase [Aquimarina sp. U1-2]|uniref:M20/M25/M40 family metallo-hydrolase n=1 Tax=Aquimarina sp. U1-2 TaxID=2823141 RepID=UPI001AEC9104|nr:M20/M25/M40 family metallo-hydrolase [Aquimarina sp. U1-2]MBP2830977.1 M20/M25/M40 family metallo-hydrolase [Aquimarina sp. U1-2]
MKNSILIIYMTCLCLFLSKGFAQSPTKHFFATMQTRDAQGLKINHPEDIKIISSKGAYSAVLLSPNAAEELHHKVLVHGPGFIYETSEKNAIASITAIHKQSVQKRQAVFSITQDALVRQSLDLVNNFNIANQIQELEDYGTRYHTTASARRAVLDLKTKWESLASNRSDVSVRIVNHTSTSMPSVVMTITGTEDPDEFVIIGGHIDSTARNNNTTNAPGADDNASGIATITEAARVLFTMNFKPKRTVEFMAFAAEEVGLRGSKEIAEDYKRRNVNVISYMQLDMTNYKGSTNDVYVSTDSYNDDALNDFLILLMNHYNASGTHQITYGTSQCNYGCSDHYSWAQQGYDVAFPFEARFNESNPNIHTTRDTFDRSPTPDATHAAKFAKLALEYIIEISNGTATGGPGGEDCSTLITAFPDQQGFEESIGRWKQSTTDDINWIMNTGGTPSNGTGPNSASQGSSYIYVEASGNGSGFPNKSAILNSPCFDLSRLTTASINFKYHMQGSAIGTLSLAISTDNGSSWVSIFNKSGAQGDRWNQARINLNTYVGSTIQFRFNAITGSSWQGDMAIDDIHIGESSVDPDPDNCTTINFNDATITSFSNQDAEGSYLVSSEGDRLSLQNNTWKYIVLNYTVTAATILEFDFNSNAQGEIHGIGFENDNILTAEQYFKIHGTQNYGITNYDTYSSGTARYRIPVGSFYTGAMDRLVFINDNDAGSGNTSTFSNIKIHEGSCGQATLRGANAYQTAVSRNLGDEPEGILSSVVINPNPTKDNFTIQIGQDSIKDIKASIYSIAGAKITQLSLQSGTQTYSAKKLKLTPGIYLLKLQTEGEVSVVERIVIK